MPNYLLPNGQEMMPNGYNLGYTHNTPLYQPPAPVAPLHPLPTRLPSGDTLLSNGQEMMPNGYNLGYTSNSPIWKP